jgi:2,4-diaminopentanoate dehydrogenase
LATQSKKIRCITVSEVVLNDHYPVADVMMDGMGFGRPLDFEPILKTPGFIELAWKAPIYLIAAGLGVEVEEVHGCLDRRTTDRDLEVAFGTVPAGTCGAVRTRAAGVVNGREAIVIEHIIRMARDVAPDWLTSEFDATYRVDIEGDPDIHCAMHLGEAEGHDAARRHGGHRHAGRQCDSVRGRRARGAAQLARHAEHVAAARIRVIFRV